MNKRLTNGSGASSGAIYLMFVRVVTILLGFVISRILSEYLTKLDYGTYSQIMLVVSTAASLSILGMADGVNFFFCNEQDKDRRESFVATIFSMQYIIGIVVAVAFIAFAVPICRYFDNTSLRPLLYISAFLPVFQNLISMLQVLFFTIGKSKSIAVRNLICSVVKLVTVVIACIYVQSLAIILISALVVDIIQCIFFYFVLHRNNCKFRLIKTDFSLVGRIFKYTIPMAGFTVVSTFARDMDKYVISAFMDTEMLAVYSNASKMLPFDIIMSSFVTILLPYITGYISKKRLSEAVSLYKQFLEMTYITTSILAVAVLICSSETMCLLYTEKYLDGLAVFCIYILVDIIRFTNITLVLSAAGKTLTILLVSLAGLVLNFVLNLICFYIFEFQGPAIATFIVTFMMGIIFLHYSAKELNTTVLKLFDVKYMIGFIAKAAIAGTVCLLIRNLLTNVDLNYIIVMAISMGIFGITMFALNFKRLFKILKYFEALKLDTASK
ncbi:MAG: oligosaccharide flippase family protein [Candidatus Ornithospirochaeta sp.]